MTISTRLAGLALALAVTPSAFAQTPGMQITNAPPQLENNIRALVQLPNQACGSAPGSLNRFLPAIRRQISRASRALGYYFLTDQTRFVQDESCWELQITVEPGDPVIVDSVDINVATDPELFAPTLQELPIREGDQLNHALYERSKSELSARAVELGFFAARFASSELRLDLQQNIAHVIIEFEPGQRYQFGAVNIEPVAGL